MKTYYDVLGVTQNAIPEIVRAAYRVMSQKYHPDRHDGDAAYTERMCEINAAYAILSEPNKRAAYDRKLQLRDAENRVSAQQNPVPAASTRGAGGSRPATPQSRAADDAHAKRAADVMSVFGGMQYVQLSLFAIATLVIVLYPKAQADTGVAQVRVYSSSERTHPVVRSRSMPAPVRSIPPEAASAAVDAGMDVARTSVAKETLAASATVANNVSPKIITPSAAHIYSSEEIDAMEDARQYHGSDPLVRRRLGLPSRATGMPYP